MRRCCTNLFPELILLLCQACYLSTVVWNGTKLLQLFVSLKTTTTSVANSQRACRPVHACLCFCHESAGCCVHIACCALTQHVG